MTETKTAQGGFASGTATVYARIAAYVEPLTGHELNRAIEIDPRLRYKVLLRYHPNVQARQTVIYHAFDGNRALEIVQPPDVDAQHRTMTLMCVEATA